MQGKRLVLASTEQLHERVITDDSRIKGLKLIVYR